MPLGTEVGLGPGHIVLDGVPALSKRGTTAPTFRPKSIVAKLLVDQDATWQRDRPRLSTQTTLLDGDSTPPPERGTVTPAPYFRLMSVVAKRLDGSRCNLVRT